jgi:hypothetical protein
VACLAGIFSGRVRLGPSKRGVNMSSPEMPNKCDTCGLRFLINYDDKKTSERYGNFFSELRKLEKLNLIPKAYYGRNIILGIKDFGGTSFCAINHKCWNNKNKPCPEWQPDYELPNADVLAIHFAKNANVLSKRVLTLTLIMMIQLISLIPILYEFIEKHFPAIFKIHKSIFSILPP